MFLTGQAGAQTSDVEAARHFQLAADQGHAASQCNLGQLYSKGRGVAQSDVEASRWYTKAAEQGLSGAQYCLGAMYATGRGVVQSFEESARWYMKAAEQGELKSYKHVGHFLWKASA
jgi:TPR repeat protein